MKSLIIVLMGAPAGGGGLANWAFPIAMLGVFYFLILRPQQQKAKKANEFRDNVAKGDSIVTIGGIHGKIESVKDTTVIVITKGGGKLEIEKSAISMEGKADELVMKGNKQ